MALTTVEIPPQFHDGALLLGALSPQQLKQLVDLLRSTARSELTRTIGAHTGLVEADARKLMEFIRALHERFREWELPPGDFARTIEQAIGQVMLSRQRTLSDAGGLTAWLEGIGRIGGVLASEAKANALRHEHQSVWCHGRIVTDVRPVFDAAMSIEAAVVVHTLKIHYQTADGGPEFYVGLTRANLLELRELVERALEKEQACMEKFPGVEFLRSTDE